MAVATERPRRFSWEMWSEPAFLVLSAKGGLEPLCHHLRKYIGKKPHLAAQTWPVL